MIQTAKKFSQKIGLEFNNLNLLQEALTHRSYLNENKSYKFQHNERLEFLGDAVLELIVTEYLFLNFDNPEGELTSWRAALVNGEMLSRVAGELDLDNHILMSKGERKDTGKARQYILANAMEAVIGAIYLDLGYEKAKFFVEKWIISKLPEVLKTKSYLDPKSYFQEKAQEFVQVTPHYEVLKEWGPDHDKNFLVGVFLNDEKVAEGQGRSKQEAQRKAAQAALEKKNWL